VYSKYDMFFLVEINIEFDVCFYNSVTIIRKFKAKANLERTLLHKDFAQNCILRHFNFVVRKKKNLR